MEKNPSFLLKEVLVGSSDKKLNRQISLLQKQGRIRKIAPRLYTPIFKESAETIIRRNLFEVIALLYPGALLSHRSAFEFEPTSAGHIFLTHTYTRKVSIPGISLRFIEGPGPTDDDRIFYGNLRVSQQARAFLENLQTLGTPGPTSRSIALPRVEEKLEQIIRIQGEEEIKQLREKAANLARELNMERAFKRLDRIIGALLSTRDVRVLNTSLGAARALGLPYDPDRVHLFHDLFRELEASHFPLRKDHNTSSKAFSNFAFFESYFSNYIEGTVFEIDEARQIVETNRPLPARDEDSHYILGTYQLVSSREQMSVLPQSSGELLSLLKERHRVLLGARSNQQPGLFKVQNNKAGNTLFVDWELVAGTLTRGFEIYQALSNPFKRAAYMLFMVSEVHPFKDGNGRIARIMMNAELVAAGQARIMIPTVYREDYLGALRKLTRRSQATAFLRMLDRVADFSLTVQGEDMDKMQIYLESCNAFTESTEGALRF